MVQPFGIHMQERVLRIPAVHMIRSILDCANKHGGQALCPAMEILGNPSPDAGCQPASARRMPLLLLLLLLPFSLMLLVSLLYGRIIINVNTFVLIAQTGVVGTATTTCIGSHRPEVQI